MANVTAAMVKELREKTGAGMMDCKKALVASDGDIEMAIDELRKKGLSAAAKKAGRITSEGLVQAWVSADEKLGVMVEVNCETDFVAKNPDFVGFTETLLQHIAKNNPDGVKDGDNPLMTQSWVGNDANTVEQTATDLIAKIGENISPRRFVRWEAANGLVHSYIHMGGKLGVLVELGCNAAAAGNDQVKTFVHQLAMHIAAAGPMTLDRESVSEDVLDRERAIYKQQVIDSGKPENIADKIVEGKLNKFYKDNCLLEQIWVHDSQYTVSKALDVLAKEIGEELSIPRFARFQLGEGLEKRSNDLAAEVAEQLEGK